MENTTTGLPKNTAAAMAYVLGAVTGIIFLIVEKDPYVRFHALQAIIFSLLVWFLAWIFSNFLFLAFLSSLLGLSWLAVTLFLIVQAHSGVEYELPWTGSLVRRFLRRS